VPSTVQIAAGSQALTDFEKGRDIYNYRCYFCHGYAGDAKTLASTYLDPKPRDFSATSRFDLSRQRMIISVTHGRAGTAMKRFSDLLTDKEIELVVGFVREAFMTDDKINTRYHTSGNGWPDHERFAVAFPFATGEIALDTPVAELTPEQKTGRNLFMASCITCHDRPRVEEEGVAWETRAVSYPRGGYTHLEPDAVSGATPYQLHDTVPVLSNPTERLLLGESLFQTNCAFCHAADGTGKNWIGSFMEPPARDLTNPERMADMSKERLVVTITQGLPGTAMSAWGHVLSQKQIESVADYVMAVFIPKSSSDTGIH